MVNKQTNGNTRTNKEGQTERQGQSVQLNRESEGKHTIRAKQKEGETETRTEIEMRKKVTDSFIINLQPNGGNRKIQRNKETD